MKIKLMFVLLAAIFASSTAWSQDNGARSAKSMHDVKMTMDKIEEFVRSKGFNVFARINHAAGAKKVDMALRPTELLIFGNPKGGTPLMQCNQWLGIELPLKVLVWQDENKQTMIGYNDPAYFANRFDIGECGSKVVANMTGLMSKLVDVAGH